MVKVKIISKKSTFVITTVYIDRDETVESLLYWVRVALSAYAGAFAQFQYEGSTYIVSVDEWLKYEKQI